MPAIDNYWNRYTEEKHYVELLMRDGYGMQASEINEIQSIQDARIAKLARALFKDGDVIRDAQILVNAATGKVNANAGEVFLDGRVWRVPAKTFTIPVKGTVSVGVRLTETVISEMEDPSLRNPAIGHATAGEPGAWRRKIVPEWSYDDGAGATNFYPIYPVDDGVQRAKEAPPALDSFNQVIARYDRDSTGGGTYVSEGLTVSPGGNLADGRQIWHLKEGRARISGFGVELPTSRRLLYDAQPDLREIEMEIVDATSAAAASTGQRITVAHPPVKDITSLKITVEETFTLTHGSYAGCTDDLPVTGVISILEIKQGDAVFPTTAWNRKGDSIDWSAAGDEPAPGSTYTAKIRYLKNYGPLNFDLDGFTVKGAVPGTQILFSYRQMLPRYDRLVMDAEGLTRWIQGVAAEHNPVRPNAPNAMLPLCTVYQNWRPSRELYNDSPRVIAFETMEAMQNRLDYIAQEVARNRLETDASTREAGAKTGIFVDPLLDDDMRDQGIAQTGAIVDGTLTLAVNDVRLAYLPAPKKNTIRPWTVKVLLEQPLRTGDMPVNPYMAFDPFPAQVTLDPALDQWTETETSWTSDVTRQVRLGRTRYTWGWRTTSTARTVETVSSSTTKLAYLRQIDVNFTVSGFGPGEKLKSATFDGLDIMGQIGAKTADANGDFSGKFKIPAKVPSGAKSVVFQGQGGSRGTGVFVGQGNLTVQTLRNVTIQYGDFYEPVAQSFAFDKAVWFAGVDLWLTSKKTEVRVELREMQNGMPTSNVLATARVQPANISTTSTTRFLFDVPVFLEANTEYCFVVMCNDPDTRVALAEMGQFDKIHQRWVSSQPYTVGVLFSSSNASTWTAHQNQDLAFRILGAVFNGSQPLTLNLGSVNVANATDLLFMAVANCPASDCFLDFTLTLPGGITMTVAAGQPISLGKKISGAISCSARLAGTSESTPELYPGAQLLYGTCASSGTYYSRSIVCTGAIKATLIYEAYVPTGASVQAQLQLDNGSWISPTSAGTTVGDEGWVEFRFTHALASNNLLKCRFTLNGAPSARPAVRSIRLMATA